MVKFSHNALTQRRFFINKYEALISTIPAFIYDHLSTKSPQQWHENSRGHQNIHCRWKYNLDLSSQFITATLITVQLFTDTFAYWLVKMSDVSEEMFPHLQVLRVRVILFELLSPRDGGSMLPRTSLSHVVWHCVMFQKILIFKLCSLLILLFTVCLVTLCVNWKPSDSRCN
jgi:hypothetical protein